MCRLLIVGIICMFSLGYAVADPAVPVVGEVFIDGAPAGEPVSLRVVKDSTQIGSVRSNADGSLEATIRIQRNEEALLIPLNEDWRPGRDFLYGYARVSAADAGPIIVRLERRKVSGAPAKLVDQDGDPVGNIRFSYFIELPLGEEPGSPTWRLDASATTDAHGAFTFRVVPGVEARYRIRVTYLEQNGDGFSANAVISSREVAAGDVQIPVQRRRLTLRVGVQWDPGYSQEPFVMDLRTAQRHRVRLKGAEEEIDSPSGGLAMMHFLDLPPGTYRMYIADIGDPPYQITPDTSTIVVPEHAELPVEHTVHLTPRRTMRISGTVLNEQDESAVAGARVHVSGRGARTADDGRFEIEVPATERLEVKVSHPEYHPAAIEVAEEQARVRLSPLPLVAVRVVQGEERRPLPAARVAIYGDALTRHLVSDAEGNVSARIPPGKYKVLITAPQMPDGEAAQRQARSPLLHLEEIDVGPEGFSRQFQVAAVTSVDVRLEPTELLAGEDREMVVVALRPSDKFIMSVSPLGRDRRASLRVGEGRYRIAVIAGEEVGADLGDVQTVPEETAQITGRIDEWKRLRLQADGTVVFLE